MCLIEAMSLFKVADNVLQLQEVGDFEAQNCLPPPNLIRSTKLHLTTEPPISCRCCVCGDFRQTDSLVSLQIDPL